MPVLVKHGDDQVGVRVLALEGADRGVRELDGDFVVVVEPFVDLLVHELHRRLAELAVERAAARRPGGVG